MPRIITVTSGKGGAGKTSISLNLALSLSKEGHRVCLFDADLGMANINILTGIYPDKNLSSVIESKCLLNDIIIRNFQGIDIIPGSTGVEKITELTLEESEHLIQSFLSLPDYDFFIFDTSAGMSEQVTSFCLSSHEIILVVTVEPTSLTDAYSLLKVLAKKEYKNPVQVIVNQVTSAKAAQNAYGQLKDTVNTFLPIKVKPLGIVASDKSVRVAVISQTPFTLLFPDSKASRCIHAIGKKLTSDQEAENIPLDIFWSKCLSILSVNDIDKETEPQTENKTCSDDTRIEKRPSSGNSEEKTLYTMLANIENGISALMEDLQTVKKLIKEDNSFYVQRSKPVDTSKEPIEISLNFESWLKHHKSELNLV